MLPSMAGIRRSIHWVLGALTYYLVWPIYYLYQITSAAWLVYRLSRTASRQNRESSSRGIHRPYHDQLQTHLQDLEKQNSKGWTHGSSDQNDEIRYPIIVVAVGWKEEKQELHPKPAERLSLLMQQYSDSSREGKFSKTTSMVDMLDHSMTQKSGPPNFSKKVPIPEHG